MGLKSYRLRISRGFSLNNSCDNVCWHVLVLSDVLDLNDFYRSSTGQMTVRLLRSRLREVWPNVRGEAVLGLGYATPFLRPFMEEASRTLDRKSTRLNSSHVKRSRMPSSA